jgi:hypothetical protein
MDNFVAFVDVVGNLVWMSAGACIMVGFLDDAVVVGIIEGFINLSATKSSSIDITSLLMVKSLPPMIKP